MATGANSVAVGGGQGAVASGLNSVALGQGAQALATNSVALGAGAIATQPNTVSLGTPGSPSRIVNLAPGINGTDATNLNQLNAVNRNANGGIAMAMAMGGGVALPESKTYGVSANFGTFGGENALSGGLALRINDYTFLNGAFGVGLEHGGAGGRVGATFAW